MARAVLAQAPARDATSAALLLGRLALARGERDAAREMLRRAEESGGALGNPGFRPLVEARLLAAALDAATSPSPAARDRLAAAAAAAAPQTPRLHALAARLGAGEETATTSLAAFRGEPPGARLRRTDARPRRAALPVQALDHEVKFVFPGAMFAVARTILSRSLPAGEPHAASLVETIYFDDRELESLEEKLGSDYLKTKIRLRWYDHSPAVWLEVKRRVGSRREKLRLPVAATGSDTARRSRALAPESRFPGARRVPALLAGAGEAARQACGRRCTSPIAGSASSSPLRACGSRSTARSPPCGSPTGRQQRPGSGGCPGTCARRSSSSSRGEPRPAAGARRRSPRSAGVASRFPSTVSVCSTESLASIAELHREGFAWGRCSAS